jgi:bifunctional non-homologous end joining protein LigD
MERISDVPGPALATLTKEPFSREGWIFERKLDGMRVIASKSADDVRLRSRTGADAGGAFPEIVDALAAIDTPDFVIDGEVVAFDGDQTSFAMLQPRMHVSDPAKARRSGVRVFYYVFDLLHLDGHSTRRLPLRERKALLRDVLEWNDPMRFTTHRNTDGKAFFTKACKQGWEGLIAKRADSPYPSGRTRDWLKIKCELGQEFVVGGWTDPQGSRTGFGALLLGYYDKDGELIYAGKVGTGFNQALLRSLSEQLVSLASPDPAYDERSLPTGQAWRHGVHWVKPELVAEIRFSEWTRDGQLRHPRFLGLRTDKKARDVVREVPT